MDDLLLIDNLLSEDEKLIRDNTRQFVEKEIITIINKAYENAEFPQELTAKIAALGLFGMVLPEEYGGLNASYTSYGLVCQELERADSGVRSFVSVQSSLCMYPIYKYGSDLQREKYLSKMAQGKLIGCFGLTEANSGSDPASMQTTAKKVSDGWVLNGSKLWITNATIADLAIVWAKTEDGIRGFIVDTNIKGFSCNEIKHKLSLRVSNTGELTFNNCLIAEDSILPGSNKGLAAPLGCLTQARYGIAWGAIGAAMACYDIALEYTLNRKQFNKPIASFQLVQKDLVDMYKEILKAQLLNLQVARLKDNNQTDYNHISLIKMNSCKEALKIARIARNLLGANGISLEYSIMRHMNNLETVYTYEGTDNIHNLILGRHITGINAFI